MLFLGYYPKTLVELTIAAAYSGVPLFVKSDPGTGKTTLVQATLNGIYGESSVWSHCFHAGTSPSLVQGTIDVQRLTHQGVVATLVDGTLMDPRYHAIVLDEIVRASDAVVHGLLRAIDDILRHRTDLPAIVALANSSFGDGEERLRATYEAISQRFGMTYEFDPVKPTPWQVIDTTVEQIVAQESDLRDYIMTLIPYPLPTMETLRDVRAAARGAMAIAIQDKNGGFQRSPIAQKVHQAYQYFFADDESVIIPPRVSAHHAALILYGIAFDTWNRLSKSERRDAPAYIAQEMTSGATLPANVVRSLVYSMGHGDVTRQVSWVSAMARALHGKATASIYNWLLAAWQGWSGDTLLRGVSGEQIDDAIEGWQSSNFALTRANPTKDARERPLRLAHAMISDIMLLTPSDMPAPMELHPENLLVDPSQWVRDVHQAFVRHAPLFQQSCQSLDPPSLEKIAARFKAYREHCEDETVQEAAQNILARIQNDQEGRTTSTRRRR
ncbi:AAA family ATPase [Roseiflexus castenholzii]|uniref:AAA family ATPase n=1 Tax=Roseiflexus castenholzii TaxID=120962 RepID=UPI003C7AD6E0